MTEDEYVRGIVAKYAQASRSPAATAAAEAVYKIIQTWANGYLLGVSYSGSSAKGTAIHGIADIDLFISLSPQTPQTLGEIYNNLANYGGFSPFSPKQQNVSIGIKYAGQAIDLVPAKKQSGNTTDHSLFRRKANTWTQTNVEKHIKLIQNSQRLDEIRALKIWRAEHGLDFPSFYLELTVLNALNGKRTSALADNVLSVFDYLGAKFTTAVVIDPANSNNRISDDLTRAEKSVIASKAVACRQAANWSQILW